LEPEDNMVYIFFLNFQPTVAILSFWLGVLGIKSNDFRFGMNALSYLLSTVESLVKTQFKNAIT